MLSIVICSLSLAEVLFPSEVPLQVSNEKTSTSPVEWLNRMSRTKVVPGAMQKSYQSASALEHQRLP